MTEAVAIKTSPVRVVLFEDRAEVVRVGKASLSEGRQWVRLSGPTLLLDDRTVQARALSDRAKVLSARVVRRSREETELQGDDVAKLNEAVVQAKREVLHVQANRDRLDVRSNYLTQLIQQWCARAATVTRPGEDSPPSDWAQAWQTIIAREDEYLAKRERILNELDDVADAHRKLTEQLDFSTIPHTVQECFVEVQVDASSMDDVEIEIKYRTPCALWRPEHMARLNQDSKNPHTGQLEWTTWGVVWQNTGELWDDIEVAFSTARPAQVADAPEVSDDVLSKRKKTAEERKQVVVEMREETVKDAGSGRAAPEMPGVDDGGKPLEFTPKGKYSLPNGGLPTRVEITKRALKASVARVLMPERAQTAYLKAEANWEGDSPLLAGPLKLARGGAVVGRTRTKFVASGEKFDTGFGPEDGVRCKRAVREEREKAKLTGSQTLTREVTLRLSNLGDSERELEITERIPVSEIDGLEVKLEEAKDWKLDQDGYLKRTIKLEPRAQLTLQFSYEIKAKSNVVLPF